MNADAAMLASMDSLDYGVAERPTLALKDVVVTRSGACFRGPAPVLTSHYAYPHALPRHLAIGYGSLLRRGWRTLPAGPTYTLGHNLWSAGYYHWVTESLPRLVGLGERRKSLTLIRPPFPRLRAVVAASTAPLGFADAVDYPAAANLKAPDLLLPPNPREKAQFDPAAMAAVRALYARAYGGGEWPRRIYVSRAGARGRIVANEAEVSALLGRAGFTTLRFEAFRFEEQVAMMAGAEAVVSIHGAGLANLAFMPPGGAVLELAADPALLARTAAIRRSQLANPSYARLASAMGLAYLIQFCRPVRQPADSLSDLLVDLPLLERNLERLVSALVRS